MSAGQAKLVVLLLLALRQRLLLERLNTAGISIHWMTGEEPAHGWVVGGVKGYEVEYPRGDNAQTEREAVDFAEGHMNFLAQPDKCFGMWYNEGRNTVSFDASTIEDDRKAAIALGRARDQYSVYHLDDGDTAWMMSDHSKPSENTGEKLAEADRGKRRLLMIGRFDSPKSFGQAVAKALEKLDRQG